MFISGSVLESYADNFVIMEKTRVPDGAGGTFTTWSEGAEILVIQQHDTTVEAQTAEQNGTASTYTFFVDKAVQLDYPDVIKRKKDGVTFQITQDTAEAKTPSISTLDLAMCKAKRWELPT